MAPRCSPEERCDAQLGPPPPKPASRPDPIKEVESLKISESIAERIESGTVTEQRFDSYDRYWMDKLRCLDDAHTAQNQLELREAERLLKKLQRYNTGKPKVSCPLDRTTMMECLLANNKQTLKCSDAVQKFVNCVDILLYQVARDSPIGVPNPKKKPLTYAERFHRF